MPALSRAYDLSKENIYLIENGRQAQLGILPGSLNQAIHAMQEDKVVCSALGHHICERFTSAKRLEWEDFRLEVTPWELEKYLPNY